MHHHHHHHHHHRSGLSYDKTFLHLSLRCAMSIYTYKLSHFLHVNCTGFCLLFVLPIKMIKNHYLDFSILQLYWFCLTEINILQNEPHDLWMIPKLNTLYNQWIWFFLAQNKTVISHSHTNKINLYYIITCAWKTTAAVNINLKKKKSNLLVQCVMQDKIYFTPK
jgi:hypothetical protein